MSKKTQKEINSRDARPSSLSNFSYNECIEIQAEAYYRALKRIEVERISSPKNPNPSWKERFSVLFEVFFRPKQLVKRKKNLADSLLNIIVSTTLDIIGLLLRAIATASLFYSLYSLFRLPENWIQHVFYIVIYLGLIMVGGMFRAASMEIELERDYNKLYAYSASLMATLAVLISLITLMKSSLT